jgi:hypothetical protein
VQTEEEVATLKAEVEREELRTNAVQLLPRHHSTMSNGGAHCGCGSRPTDGDSYVAAYCRRAAWRDTAWRDLRAGARAPQSAEIVIRLTMFRWRTRANLSCHPSRPCRSLGWEERQLVVLVQVLTATDAGRLARVLTV